MFLGIIGFRRDELHHPLTYYFYPWITHYIQFSLVEKPLWSRKIWFHQIGIGDDEHKENNLEDH